MKSEFDPFWHLVKTCGEILDKIEMNPHFASVHEIEEWERISEREEEDELEEEFDVGFGSPDEYDEETAIEWGSAESVKEKKK